MHGPPPLDPPTFGDVQVAMERVRPHVRTTPLLECPALDAVARCHVTFKCENLQHIGAFKARGACNAIFSLDATRAARGVVAHSSGNHAAAVARAAKLRGIPASVVMPHNSAPNKLAAVRALGVEPVLCGPDARSRQAATDAIVDASGAVMIHPYDDPRTIAGQGTAALEWTEQSDPLDVVVVPVGGGGLLAGTLLTLKKLWPETRVVGAEPTFADDAFRSLQTGEIESPTRYDTIADGLRTPLGKYTFPIIRDHVDAIFLATEGAIAAATRTTMESTRTVVEPSAAVPLAAVLAHRDQFAGKRVGIILSGGNLDLDALPW